jgi:hypothetical protein
MLYPAATLTAPEALDILPSMHYDPLTALPFLAPLGILAFPLIGLLILWTLIIKGIALWRSARNGHKIWFVFLLIVNSLGILELVYIIWFSKPAVKIAPAPAPAPVSPAPEA